MKVNPSPNQRGIFFYTRFETVRGGDLQYENNTLQFISHPEGYIKATKVNEDYQFNYVYQYKDHLGNIRMNYALDPSDNQLKILNEDHYYPFGLKHTNYNSNVKGFQEDPGFSTLRIIQVPSEGNTYKYKYNGKEWQDELGLNIYDYGWRNYMPDVARWMQSDPLLNDLKFTFDESKIDDEDDEEVYEALVTKLQTGDGIFNTDNLNQYGYGYNNPVSFEDPDGKCPICIPVLALLLYSEFANAPTGDGEIDGRNYNDTKGNRTIATETVWKRGGNLIDSPGPMPGVPSQRNPGVSPLKTKSSEKTSKGEKTYQTYTKKNEKTGEVYSGKTSGKGTPTENIAKRDKTHHKNKDGFGPARLDKSSKNKDAIRGREQQNIDRNGGAKSGGGTSGNSIRGVSKTNPNAKKYDDAAKREFGN